MSLFAVSLGKMIRALVRVGAMGAVVPAIFEQVCINRAIVTLSIPQLQVITKTCKSRTFDSKLQIFLISFKKPQVTRPVLARALVNKLALYYFQDSLSDFFLLNWNLGEHLNSQLLISLKMAGPFYTPTSYKLHY